jgi:hypothetical protein
VTYLLGALERFDTLSPQEVQKIGFEIAALGMSEIDPNDPAQKYALRSLPGNYSGLHLLCLMYAAFKRVAPGHDVGFDLTRAANSRPRGLTHHEPARRRSKVASRLISASEVTREHTSIRISS